MIETFYDTSFTVLRNQSGTATSSDATITAATSTGVLRPVDQEASVSVGNDYGKAFALVCDDGVDVKARDQIVIAGKTYTVQGVGKYADLEDDTDSHLDISLVSK